MDFKELVQELRIVNKLTKIAINQREEIKQLREDNIMLLKRNIELLNDCHKNEERDYELETMLGL